ncbi:MAG: DUF975 family protein [Clostridiales bacterium]|nr:DUF975 family protein [Clostridiales bacterium]
MWTRKELKEKAKAAVKRNYWKAVLVSVLLILLGEGLIPAAAASGSSADYDENEGYVISVGNSIGESVLVDDYVISVRDNAEGSAGESVVADVYVIPAETVRQNGDNAAAKEQVENELREALNELEQIDDSILDSFGAAFLIVLLLAAVVIVTGVIIFEIFIGSPLRVGAGRFMLNGIDDKGNIADLGFAFDHNYMNAVKTIFFRNLHIFLWSLLFIVPGIYKSYQYRFVEYILAENPHMPRKEVLELSKKMMEGQKWNAFVLDMSFIPWHILNTVTCGLTKIFYVKPYICMTDASLYRAIIGKEYSYNDGI